MKRRTDLRRGRRWLTGGLALLLPLALSLPGAMAAGTTSDAKPPAGTIEEVHDFQALGREAAAHRVPILLMIASEDCHYCERLEEEVLAPMRLDGADPRDVLLRKLTLEDSAPVRDFQGQRVSAEEMAMRFHYSVTPTLFLLDPEGRSLVPPIAGYTSPDFYPAYLDQAIDVARRLLRRRG